VEYSTPNPHLQGKAAAAPGSGSLALAENAWLASLQLFLRRDRMLRALATFFMIAISTTAIAQEDFQAASTRKSRRASPGTRQRYTF
jgi:hypothetical protein